MLSLLWKSPLGGGANANTTTTTPDQTPDPAAPLVSSWQVRAEAGEPLAVVRVRGLQSAMAAGRDAWGRAAAGNKPQPVTLSTEVAFARAFETASARDAVDAGDTAHYGTLSKTLLAGVELFNSPAVVASANNAKSEGKGKEEGGEIPKTPRTADVLEILWVQMTGRVLDGSRVALPPDQVPFLDLDAARVCSLALTLRLPKASLLGDGVSLSTTACFRDLEGEEGQQEERRRGKKMNPLRSYARALRLHGLRVPTLVGVNSNERAARQMVVADVEVDRFDVFEDIHAELERFVVEVRCGISYAFPPPFFLSFSWFYFVAFLLISSASKE